MKVYSKWPLVIRNYDDEANPVENQLFTDGVNTPSEFIGNSYNLDDMVASWYLPPCTNDMSCGYCSESNDGCGTVANTNNF